MLVGLKNYVGIDCIVGWFIDDDEGVGGLVFGVGIDS